MATKKQKEELMATLKFTPRNYRVEIWGYGGEVYWGNVDRKIYDYFKEKEINIEQYARGWDEDLWNDIPQAMRPFEPGTPYDCDHGGHTAGATFDDASVIVVYDEKNNEVWKSPLGPVLKDNGATFDCIDEHYIDDYPAGTAVFWGAEGEKGTFFSSDFEIKSPFDPSKLRVLYDDMNGWELTSGVQYDGVDIDTDDYDTSGKWSEAKWVIASNTEEVYEGEEREEDE